MSSLRRERDGPVWAEQEEATLGGINIKWPWMGLGQEWPRAGFLQEALDTLGQTLLYPGAV